MSEQEVREAYSSAKPEQPAKPIFELTYKKVRNPYKVQMYLDFGVSQSGPWLLVGVNETEYAFGYQPRQHSQDAGKLAPHPHQEEKTHSHIHAV